MSAQVLSFNQSKPKNEVCRYIVVKAKIDKNSDLRFSISPEIMHWRDDLWIIDLNSTKRYWYATSLQKNQSLEDALKEQLNISLDSFQWINCKHPWQGLILLPMLSEERRLYYFEEDYCQNLARSISWESWLKESDTLYKHLQNLVKQTALSKFSTKRSQLLRAMERLGLEDVYDLEQADTSSIQKRFGLWIAKLWEWTFPQKRSDLPLMQGLQDLNEFPWICEKPKQTAAKMRALDYSVDQWDQLEPFLQEDIAHIEKAFLRQKKISVCQIDWSLELYGGQSFSLKIDFRNPYAIFDDAPVFNTALTQARYQFEAWQKDLSEEKSFHDYLEAYKIVSWKLEVSKNIYLQQSEQSLEIDSGITNYYKILDLENKLPKPIEHYRIKKGFAIKAHETKEKTEGIFTQKDNLWTKTASHRPLYYKTTQKKLRNLPYRSFFLERNSTDWWKEEHSEDYNWDFYKSHYQRNWNWIVKNSFGEIYELGRFD